MHCSTTSDIAAHAALHPASGWIQRWSHLVPADGSVLDVACGTGRHMQWFAERGHAVTGIDRSAEALDSASQFGEVINADIEGAPWPLAGRWSVVPFSTLWALREWPCRQPRDYSP